MLFAPGLPDLAAVGAVCAAVSKPFNFMVGIKGESFFPGSTRCGRSQAHQPRDLALSRCNDRLSGRRKRSKRQGTVQLPRSVRDNARTQQTHGNLTALCTENASSSGWSNLKLEIAATLGAGGMGAM